MNTRTQQHEGMGYRRNGSLLLAAFVAAVAALVLGIAPSFSAVSTASQDPVGAPTSTPGSLIAIADLHGDIGKAKKALQLLNVVDGAGNWAAEGATVVQLGDLVDRGPDSLKLIRYMHKLQDQAAAHNSRLVLLLGNHELMNLKMDFRYVAPEELIHLGQQQQQQQQQQRAAQPAAAQPMQQQGGGPEPDLTAAAEVAASQPPSAVNPAAVAAYSAGLDVWAALWRRQATGKGPEVTAAHTGQATATAAGAAAAAATQDASDPAADAGSVRSSIAARHQLLAVYCMGPCATAFVHAGLTPHMLQELLAISGNMSQRHSSSSSSADHTSASSIASSSSSSSSSRDNGGNSLPSSERPGENTHASTQSQPLSGSPSGAVKKQQPPQQQQQQLQPQQQQQQGHTQHHHRLQAGLLAAVFGGADGQQAGAAAAAAVGVVSAGELQLINTAVQQALSACEGQNRGCFGSPALLHQLWSLLGSGQGPVWSRSQAQGPETRVCGHLAQVLSQLGVQRLVVGHTPQVRGRAGSRCGGRLLLLDTGMSSGMMNSPAAAWVCHPGGGAGGSSGGSSSGGSGSSGSSGSGGSSSSSGGSGSSTGRSADGSGSDTGSGSSASAEVAAGSSTREGTTASHSNQGSASGQAQQQSQAAAVSVARQAPEGQQSQQHVVLKHHEGYSVVVYADGMRKPV